MRDYLWGRNDLQTSASPRSPSVGVSSQSWALRAHYRTNTTLQVGMCPLQAVQLISASSRKLSTDLTMSMCLGREADSVQFQGLPDVVELFTL